ncbi:MAG: FAD-binding protein [Planctomycetales bacterium]|nr:FAD-binding protein [Planctomycetales bacterium]
MVSHNSPIENFGRNLSFQPTVVAVPNTEEDVLRILAEHRGRQIRVVGRLHSWSEAPRGDDVLLDLKCLNDVRTEQRDGKTWATVGGGCQIKRILIELERQTGTTLRSLGLIAEQTIAGAISTGTHGSGKHSLSHYMVEVRVATYDAATGQPVIRTITEGPELRAARCSLGCLGVIVSVGFWSRSQYRIEEHFRRYSNLDDVLAAESKYPLQQFFFVPWRWDFFAQHRREVESSRSRLAAVYRLYWSLVFDLGFHLILLLLTRLCRSRRAIQFFFRQIMPWTVIRGWKVVDKSQKMLVMRHELFRHIEIEMFVKRSQLPAAVSYTQELLMHFDGAPNSISDTTRQRLADLGLLPSLTALGGCYTHHYPVCIRRVLPDDTLISMASGDDEPYYALSFISYSRPSDRDGFFAFADFLARSAASLFGARPHWGKVCPISGEQAESLYPHLGIFRDICSRFDPGRRFRNGWVTDLLYREPADRK